MGRYSEAADALRDIPQGFFPPQQVEEAVRVLRAAPAQVNSAQTVLSTSDLGFVYLYTGSPEPILDFFESRAAAGVPNLQNIFPAFLWAPSYAPVRKTERFKEYVRKYGMVDYWRARGWPDRCHPTTGDDFACD